MFSAKAQMSTLYSSPVKKFSVSSFDFNSKVKSNCWQNTTPKYLKEGTAQKVSIVSRIFVTVALDNKRNFILNL